MNTVERVKLLCKEKNISIRRLELDCDFGNGYIASLKKGTLPDNRLKIIADYLDVSVYYLMTGESQIPDIEYDMTDQAITQLPNHLKLYALKLARLSSDEQEHVISLIDMLSRKNAETSSV